MQPRSPTIIAVGELVTIKYTLGDEITLIGWNVELMDFNTTINVKPNNMS